MRDDDIVTDEAMSRAVGRGSRSVATAIVALLAGTLTWMTVAMIAGVSWLLQKPGLEYYQQSDLPKHLWRFTTTIGIVMALAVAVVSAVLGRRREGA